MVFNEINPFDDEEHETLMGIWWSGILLKRQAKNFFRDFPVNETQFNALMALKYAEKPLSQQDLSGRLLVDKSNLTGMIDELEKQKFVRRRDVPENRRVYRLELTKKGFDFLETAEASYRERVHRIISVFTPKERKQLIQFMVKLQKAMDRLEK